MRSGRRRAPPADPTDVEAAWEAALRRLAHQPLPREVLGQRLRKLGYAAGTIGQVMARAEELGYLDDRAYAEAVVRRRSGTRGASLIAQELRAKGIDAVQVAHALEQLDPAAEEARALALARRTVRQHRPSSKEELQRRVGALLGRRGFRTATIVRTLARLRDARLPAGDAEPLDAATDDAGQ